MKPNHVVGVYFIFQAIGVLAWWVLLWTVPEAADWFQPDGWSRDALMGFWLADLGLVALGSLVTAAVVLRRERPAWASNLVWALAAASGYGALYCIGVSVWTGQAWLASAPMTGMAGLTLAMATIFGNGGQSPATIRVTPMRPRRAVVWTMLQTVIFWGAFLWVLPMGIMEVEDRLGLSHFEHAGQRAGSFGVFVMASGLGLLTGITMARIGKGTPLPTATAPELVSVGPYRWVRNPMALSGIVQGLAVGWWLGSVSVLGYALAGALLWHCFVRPVEEADLERRFGDRYQTYRQTVGLWVPRFRSLAQAGGDP